MSYDEQLEKEIEANDGDINKVFLKLQEEFFIKYNKSVKLNNFEKHQLKLLSFYKRRNNAILDLLSEFEQGEDVNEDRIRNVEAMNESLKGKLSIDDLDEKKIRSLKMDLFLDESISELEIDDLINISKNPQDIEFWLRRNQPNLVLSRFKPIEHKNNKLIKNDSNLDNLNNSLNNHVNNVGSKKRKKI
ncbi:hypothetical protein CLIB1444_07S03114 [[Candida] jaroonii]|uniref:Uncharacterized protein n=1 Tax=[Candida] jaroonii TaxID=467808 RepID=A0ACA9YAG8_9ASCO|nr:hypothetical protein CLIB1444_07S03114 [[Candida] jaroonii]